MLSLRIILWIFQGINVLAVVYMQFKASIFTHRQYFLFATGTMLGAAATAVDAAIGSAWGAASTQGFFALLGLVGMGKRYRVILAERRASS